jgi:serine/threonine protein phosphatase 1
MIVIGDVHGCFDTLMELIKQFPKDQEYCFVGDLIDRGPKSKEVVDFVYNNNIKSCLGNHEEFLTLENHHLWCINGGSQTLESYESSKELFNDHKKFLTSLPLYLKFDDLGLIVSHSSASTYFLNNCSDNFRNYILWDRPTRIKKIPNYFNVFGHTPNKKYIIKKNFANIDTGCVFGYYLTALQFPEMKIYQQKCVDEMRSTNLKYVI